ncbi:MAG: EamA family transporter [Woeseia sp.]|jgi:drug/metabolite transporter (DMT)-like permease|nr:EamA family transporter [Woeseia sp.]MBT6209360.1 EamA family transporter [Woeseia sp.]
MQVAILYVLIVLIWGSTWIAITFQLGIVAEEVSVAYRFLLGSIALFIYAWLTGRQIKIPRHQYGNVIITGALMFSANYLFTYYAINYVTSGLVAVSFSLLVVGNALFERLFFKTPLERRLLVASTLGVVGISCIFWPEIASLSLQDRSVMGVVLALIAVLFASLGNMGAIRSNRRQLPVVAVNAHGMAWGALVSALVAIAMGREFNFSFETGYVLSLAYLAIFGSAVAFGCYLALLRMIGSARAAYSSVLFPIVALLISTVAENYQWSVLAFIGILFIIAGNWLALSQIKRN